MPYKRLGSGASVADRGEGLAVQIEQAHQALCERGGDALVSPAVVGGADVRVRTGAGESHLLEEGTASL